MFDDIISRDENLTADESPSCIGESSSCVLGEILKPVEGMYFKTFEDGYKFYQDYARDMGFDTRKQAAKKSADGSQYKWRYACCNRQGKLSDNEYEVCNVDDSQCLKTSKKRCISRCGCPAKVCFRFEGNLGWLIYKFVEDHNHGFVGKEHNYFMKVNRKLDDVQKRFIMGCAKVKIGTTDAYNFISEIYGGKDRLGCTLVDMRNFVRDLRAYVKGCDAQLLLNEFKSKKEIFVDFFYSYEVDAEGRLKNLFWADSTSRKNYDAFGDIVAFDTTYSTNRYCMIFSPFTGKDNHGRPVTFACGLLSKEDSESFSWLFTNFVACMGQSPKLIITDQDLGMKVAVERVLSGTRHRWCMWHIMVKLSQKVPSSVYGDENFKKELNNCVWADAIDPQEFEVLWNDVCSKYGLEDNNWLQSLYTYREYWIPAYFRDIPMSGIMRTTSISESENSFFKRFTRPGVNLIEFWMKFNQALDAQRMAAQKLDYADQNSTPKMKTCLDIEKNVSMLFTATIFYKIQEEIAASLYSCRISQLRYVDDAEEYMINDRVDGEFLVSYNKEDGRYICGCKLFDLKGILCRHIFFVLKNLGLNHIPETYIARRWLKSNLLKVGDAGEDVGHTESIEIQRLSNNLMATFFKWMKRMKGQKSKLASFVEAIDAAGSSLCSDKNVVGGLEDVNVMEEFYGAIPSHIEVASPTIVKTKGSGSRLICRKEKAIRMKDKPPRRCAKCGQLARHDARNCGKEKRV